MTRWILALLVLALLPVAAHASPAPIKLGPTYWYRCLYRSDGHRIRCHEFRLHRGHARVVGYRRACLQTPRGGRECVRYPRFYVASEATPARCWQQWTSAYSDHGQTYTGTYTDWGTIAGPASMLYEHVTVRGYGPGVILDTGGPRIQSGWLDLWMPTAGEALAWGLRLVTVCAD